MVIGVGKGSFEPMADIAMCRPDVRIELARPKWPRNQWNPSISFQTQPIMLREQLVEPTLATLPEDSLAAGKRGQHIPLL